MIFFLVLLTVLMLTVIITDTTRYIIPNWLVAVLFVFYPVFLYCAPGHIEWQIALLFALGTFAVGFGLFAANIMGAGDIKLLTAAALWTGKSAFPTFIMGVGLFGGLLALVLVVARPFTAFMFSKLQHPPAIPRVLTVGEPVPYGVAIALIFLLLLWKSDIPGLVLH